MSLNPSLSNPIFKFIISALAFGSCKAHYINTIFASASLTGNSLPLLSSHVLNFKIGQSN